MRIGYARVSGASQDLGLQKKSLLDAGCDLIFEESVSGKDNHRPELKKMFSVLREGDVVVIYKIDRISRSLKGLLDIMRPLQNALGF